MRDVYDLIPKDKFDNSTIDQLMRLNNDDIKPILPDLLGWIADYNWPIAVEITKVLILFPTNLTPLIEDALDKNSTDHILKYWIILKLLPSLPQIVQASLEVSVNRICNNPTKGEKEEEVVDVAIEYINNKSK